MLQQHPFDRNGLARLSDLKTSEWQELFNPLEDAQKAFLDKESMFRSPEYKWPGDPLHTWSRVWEYPFAFHHLRKWREMLPAEPQPRVIDLGSGVTFFPFSVAQLGCQVICADIDPICATDIARAVKAVSTAPGSVDFRKVDGEHLPFNDDEADAIYCISVLEHITAFKQTAAEMARVLKPGGLLVLTIDLDLRSDSELGVNDYHRLRAELARHFTQAQPEETVHPMDMLQSNTGPYPMQRTESWLPWLFVKRKILRPLLGRASTKQYSLAVAGFVLTRK